MERLALAQNEDSSRRIDEQFPVWSCTVGAPVDVLLSAPITTPPSYATAMMVVCTSWQQSWWGAFMRQSGARETRSTAGDERTVTYPAVDASTSTDELF
jgi:hypothetical protein